MKVIDVKSLKKSFAGKKVLEDASMAVSQGDIYGFLGRKSGCPEDGPFCGWRTIETTYKCLAGVSRVLRMDAGGGVSAIFWAIVWAAAYHRRLSQASRTGGVGPCQPASDPDLFQRNETALRNSPVIT